MVEYEKPENDESFESNKWRTLMSRTRSLYKRIWGDREEREMGDGD